MTKTRVRFDGFSDLVFFFNWDSALTLAGTVGIGILELDLIPKDWIIYSFIEDHKVAVLALLAALIVLPPAIVRGIIHLRNREELASRATETSAALRGIGSRASNIIFKARESFAGNATRTYQNHSLADCKNYFESRPIPFGGDRPDDTKVEACFYELNIRSKSKLLERKLYTHENSTRMRANFSSRNPEEQLCIETMLAGEHVYCSDVRDPREAARLKIMSPEDRPYRSFVTVPVFRDRKAVGDGRVLGMLSVSANHPGILHESDKNVLSVYAWFLAAAYDLDELSKTRTQAPSIDGGRA